MDPGRRKAMAIAERRRYLVAGTDEERLAFLEATRAGAASLISSLLTDLVQGDVPEADLPDVIEALFADVIEVFQREAIEADLPDQDATDYTWMAVEAVETARVRCRDDYGIGMSEEPMVPDDLFTSQAALVGGRFDPFDEDDTPEPHMDTIIGGGE